MGEVLGQNLTLALFIATALLGAVQLLGAFILNSISKKQDEVAKNLKELNDAVLGKYITRAEVERIAEDIDRSMHKLRESGQRLRSEVDVLMALQKLPRES